MQDFHSIGLLLCHRRGHHGKAFGKKNAKGGGNIDAPALGQEGRVGEVKDGKPHFEDAHNREQHQRGNPWLAYFVAILMGFFMILPTVFVSSTVRLGGGNYSMLAGLAGLLLHNDLVFRFEHLVSKLTAKARSLGNLELAFYRPPPLK